MSVAGSFFFFSKSHHTIVNCHTIPPLPPPHAHVLAFFNSRQRRETLIVEEAWERAPDDDDKQQKELPSPRTKELAQHKNRIHLTTNTTTHTHTHTHPKNPLPVPPFPTSPVLYCPKTAFSPPFPLTPSFHCLPPSPPFQLPSSPMHVLRVVIFYCTPPPRYSPQAALTETNAGRRFFLMFGSLSSPTPPHPLLPRFLLPPSSHAVPS